MKFILHLIAAVFVLFALGFVVLATSALVILGVERLVIPAFEHSELLRGFIACVVVGILTGSLLSCRKQPNVY